MTFPKATIIGTGNLASHLSKAFEQSGIQVELVYGRSPEKARKIAGNLYATHTTDSLDFSDCKSRLFFLCVSDHAIVSLSQNILLPPDAILLHCSGATPIEAITRTDGVYGVFYPLQTFTKTRKLSFKELPICLEASSDKAEQLLELLVKKMGGIPCFMNSAQRLTIHLAAVFACNFSNHLYSIAQQLLDEHGLPFSLLDSLIKETANKALELNPRNAQTGPAARNDYKTMNLHRELLSNRPEWQELYDRLSEDIKNDKEG